MTTVIAVLLTTLGCGFLVSSLLFLVQRHLMAYVIAAALFFSGAFFIVLGSALLEDLHKWLRRP